MKMRKILFIVMIFVLTLALLGACAPAAPEVIEVEVEKEVVVTQIVEVEGETVIQEVEVTAVPEPEAMAEPEPLRVALIVGQTVNDLGFSLSMYQSLLALQEEMGEENFEVALSDNTGPDVLPALRDYASQGFDIVIAHSGIYGSAVKQIAAEFPDVSFAWGPSTDNFQQAGITNVSAYRARVEDGGYVMGAMAAVMTETKIIGVCGPIEASDAVKYINAFKMGVEDTDPSVTVNVIYTGSFSDSALSAAAAETLIAGGADILTGIAASLPCMNAAQEKGLLYFGVQGDWTELGPETVPATLAYDWSPVINDLVSTYQAGVAGGKVYHTSMQNGGLVLIYSDIVEIPEEAMQVGEAAIQGIEDGSVKLP
jgi:basic membrane lipoprotein Med (substrate-binding protein (PBP1-ABC) superfamily)